MSSALTSAAEAMMSLFAVGFRVSVRLKVRRPSYLRANGCQHWPLLIEASRTCPTWKKVYELGAQNSGEPLRAYGSMKRSVSLPVRNCDNSASSECPPRAALRKKVEVGCGLVRHRPRPLPHHPSIGGRHMARSSQFTCTMYHASHFRV